MKLETMKTSEIKALIHEISELWGSPWAFGLNPFGESCTEEQIRQIDCARKINYILKDEIEKREEVMNEFHFLSGVPIWSVSNDKKVLFRTQLATKDDVIKFMALHDVFEQKVRITCGL